MYFWKINKLKEELRGSSLPEKESLKYLIASTIMYGIVMIPSSEINMYDIYSGIIQGIISVLGVIYIYRCNNGNNGKYFLQRYFSIGWVVFIRLTIMLALPSIIGYFTILVIYSEAPGHSTLYSILLPNVLSLLFYWRFGEHAKSVAISK